MSQYTFKTREIGPNSKGSTLTYDELDSSLLFLSESINETFSGSNYLFVKAEGTPTQNATELSASYVQAKNSSPSSTNRIAILVSPGSYEFDSTFTLDTEYIDILSFTGERDILIVGNNTVSISADNVFVRGIDVDTKNFTIADNLSSIKLVNCKGGDLSFGGTIDPAVSGSLPLTSVLVNGTFINCEGGNFSFAGNGISNGIFENCTGGDSSFGFNIIGSTFINCEGGDFSFGGAEGDLDASYFENCTGGEGSFTLTGNILSDTILKDCTGDLYSFASQGFIEGNLYGCRLTSGSFNILNIQGNGSITLGIDGDNNVITQP